MGSCWCRRKATGFSIGEGGMAGQTLGMAHAGRGTEAIAGGQQGIPVRDSYPSFTVGNAAVAHPLHGTGLSSIFLLTMMLEESECSKSMPMNSPGTGEVSEHLAMSQGVLWLECFVNLGIHF
ncbi:hypothetical protein llap_4559 [Limosa lapponica baueri]|uniref:Uncharacterized protein n=1 Tax=Limosa lapponica baueri TaxID=1758121 RepID=A0A2I0UGJ3_LIMLA|nr:hypothetical protein llap_4559 [Limosa lapponica baueri]